MLYDFLKAVYYLYGRSDEQILQVYYKTLACILSLSAINTAVPLPALAMPFTSAVEAPEPIPNEKHLRWIHVCKTAEPFELS